MLNGRTRSQKAYCNDFGSSLETTKVQDPRKKRALDYSSVDQNWHEVDGLLSNAYTSFHCDPVPLLPLIVCYQFISRDVTPMSPRSKALLLSVPGVLRREEENGWVNLVQPPLA